MFSVTDDELNTTDEIETLESLFDPWEGASIRTDEDYRKLGEIFIEEE